MEGAELPAQHDFQIPSELAPEPLPLYLAHTRRPAAERRLVLDFAHHRNMFAVLIGAFVAGALISLMANGAQRQIEWRGQLAFFAPAQQPYYAQTKEGSAKKAGNPSEPSVTALPLRSTIVVARPAGGNQTRPRAQTSAASEKSKDIPAAAALKALPGPAASQAANPVAEADSPTPPVQQTNAVTPSEQPEAVAPATATQRTTDLATDSKAPAAAADSTLQTAAPADPQKPEAALIDKADQTAANRAPDRADISQPPLTTSAPAEDSDRQQAPSKERDNPATRRNLFDRVLGFVLP